jgi:hypothetical protein
MPATNSDSLGNCLKQPGQLHRDTKRSSIYRDFAKRMPTLIRQLAEQQLIKPLGR